MRGHEPVSGREKDEDENCGQHSRHRTAYQRQEQTICDTCREEPADRETTQGTES